ncbi:class I SAM-dependent methyltransferase [Candidatus Margulisiibacteriota bacterium]
MTLNTNEFQLENQETGRYYSRLHSHYGDSVKSAGWFSEYTQRQRFMVGTFIDDLTEAEVLDIGCGQGDFFAYLQEQYKNIKYEGLDLSSEAIKAAKKKHLKAVFISADFFEHSFKRDYDFVFASGAFNHRVRHQLNYIKTAIAKMFTLCRKGISFNLLSGYAPEKTKYHDQYYYYDSLLILKFCFSLTQYVALYQHYLPNDFTVNMYKK